MKKSHTRVKKEKGISFDRPVLEPNAAGIDVGSRQMFVSVPPDRDSQPVRVFDVFTDDLNQLADWLEGCGVTTVAMESTGVYWIPLFEILEQRKLRPCLVDARHMKMWMRTDWQECQWIQYLHSVGLLRPAFRPAEEVCAVRALMRHRKNLVEMASQHVQHMHKALTQMNLQIHHVLSDLTGVTGMAIVDAIVDGERDASELAKLRDPRTKATTETIRKSLIGNWRPEHLFALKQSRECYSMYQQQISACDREIEKLLQAAPSRREPSDKPLPPNKKRKRNNGIESESAFSVRTEAYKLFGVDLTQVPGLAQNVLSLYAEIGSDMSRWATPAQFVSWLALCPDNDVSGGRTLWRGMRKCKNRAAAIFRMAAYSLHRSLTPLGDYLRRMKGRLGPAGAITATARKIAVIDYAMVKNQVPYDETRWAEYEALRKMRIEAKLHRQARRLGYQLVPLQQPAS